MVCAQRPFVQMLLTVCKHLTKGTANSLKLVLILARRSQSTLKVRQCLKGKVMECSFDCLAA